MTQRRLCLAAAGLLALNLLTACNSKAGATNAPAAPTESGGSPSVHGGSALIETLNSKADTLAWSTKSDVAPKRLIEVGDHPNIQMEKFEIGNRAEKVRFFMADEVGAARYYSKSPQDLLFQEDGAIGKSENGKWSPLALVIDTPVNLGLGKFADDSNYNGLAVSPQLLLCAAGALANLKEAGLSRARIFQNWQIDAVNVFVKPVQHSAEAESKMAIDPKGRVLNFQISVWSRSGDCFLPSASDVGEALDIADQRVED